MPQPDQLHDESLRPDIIHDLTSPATGTATSHELKRSRASWDLRRETIERVNALAAEYEVNKYVVAQRLLDYALQQLDAGNLKLKRVPVVSAWGLKE